MKLSHIKTPAFTVIGVGLLFSSCGVSSQARYKEPGYSYTSDRKINEDTYNLNNGRPLQHFPNERRLKMAREDRFIDRLMND